MNSVKKFDASWRNAWVSAMPLYEIDIGDTCYDYITLQMLLDGDEHGYYNHKTFIYYNVEVAENKIRRIIRKFTRREAERFSKLSEI